MRGVLWAALAAAGVGLVLLGARADGGGACELRWAIRSATPSQRCIACHEGSLSSAIGFGKSADGSALSHPVNVDYAAAALSHPGEYVPAAALPRTIVLVRGKVECTSCHDGASRTPHLVAGHEELCTGCHRL